MKRLLTILAFCTISIIGYCRDRHTQQETTYGPISPFVGFWWSYVYPDTTEDMSGIVVESFSKEFINHLDAMPKEWKSKLSGINIVSTNRNKTCTENSYKLLIWRIKEMDKQIQELILNGNDYIQVPMRKIVHGGSNYNIIIYYAKGRKPFQDQILFIRYSDVLFEPAFVVEFKGKLSFDDISLFMELNFGN